MKSVKVVDSHTGGEPTRVVIEGGPDLGRGPLADRLARFATSWDAFRSSVVNEPRGHAAVVGALLCEPANPTSAAGVIFFNNVGVLGMCGHGTIGLVATLAHLGRIRPGMHRIETPVGDVAAKLHEGGLVSVTNVPCYRFRRNAEVNVEGWGRIRGDVAWGGNWFFLIEEHGQPLELKNVEALTDLSWRIRTSLADQGITGKNGEEIDHIELFSPAFAPGNHFRNFTLCPGKIYDRSPCGTGTSAKLACLFADGKLKDGDIRRVESITGSVFEGSVRKEGEHLLPTITGSAFVVAEATLLFDPLDPFVSGIHC